MAVFEHLTEEMAVELTEQFMLDGLSKDDAEKEVFAVDRNMDKENKRES